MDREVILQLSRDALYGEFIEKVLSDAFGSMETVSELEQSERYKSDFIFRIHVQTARQFIDVCVQDFDSVFEKADDLIDRARALGLPKVLNLNYHILGIAYKLSGYYEKAIESFFNVLKYERIYELKRLTSIVYYYIGEIHMINDACDIAIDFLKLGMQVLEETKDTEPRYGAKKIMFASAMFQSLYETKRYDEMYHYIESIREQSLTDPSPATDYAYQLAMMYYHFSKKEFVEAKEVFYRLLEQCGDNEETKKQYIKIFCALLWEYDLDVSYYEKELLMAEAIPDSRGNLINYSINNYLYQYYEKIGNRDVAFRRLEKSFQSIESEMLQLKKNSVNFFKLIEKNFSIEENIYCEQKKNSELILITEEAIRNKELAESTLRRLAVVSELGKKLTYSSEVEDIVETVYQNLLNSIPLESFILMIKDSQRNQLETLVFYENGVRKDSMIIDYENKDSAFVETFKTNRFIMIDDFYESVRFRKQREKKTNGYFRSVLFLPLSIENEVLGVCSVQHSEPHIYSKEHIEFLEALMPYLTIALNNAFKSEALEREIKHHKETQNELEEVNHKLEKLSYLDGLTQISNRRDFENRILGYLRRSKEEELAISVFMFDIDYFKNFNDTYGHLEGDKALQAVAMVVQKHFDRVGGISARFGGEEFVAACLGLNEEESIALGNEIREDVFALGVANEKTPLGKLSISAGIAHAYAMDDLKKSVIMRWADVSLYHAKCTGRNKVVLKSVGADDEPPEGLE